jgi:Bacterial PH domain
VRGGKPQNQGQPRLFQTRQQAWGIAATVGVVSACLLGGVIEVAGVHQQHPSVAAKIAGVGLLVAMGGAFAIGGVRATRAGVVADRDGITVRNPFTAKRLRWDEIDRFSVEAYGPTSIAYVHLRDGTAVRIWGIQGQNRFLFRNSRWATEPVDQLNALLRERQAGNIKA